MTATPHLDKIVALAQVRGYEREEHGRVEQVRPSLRKTLDWYASQHYAGLNDALRRGAVPAPLQQHVSELDRAFRESEPLKEPLVVYRGVQDLGRDQERMVHPGGRIFDRAYVSTSATTATPHSIGDRGTVMKITIPAGHRVLRPNPAEDEVLLPRSTALRVKSVDPQRTAGPFSFRHVEAEVA